ncbi:hypothetical protein [Streptomyces sp. NPDC094472]|uniref:hypothetical protein n=1 Tax=Streptomyces sp. NPDC094472 TaxID=3155080 RepID=UPI00332F7EF1
MTILAKANRDPYQERTKFQVLREHGAPGIVFCGSDIEGSPGTADLDREVNRAVGEGTRLVSLAPRGFVTTQIIVDNEATAYNLTKHMPGLGCRDIVIAVPATSWPRPRWTWRRSSARCSPTWPPLAELGRLAVEDIVRKADEPPIAPVCTLREGRATQAVRDSVQACARDDRPPLPTSSSAGPGDAAGLGTL